MKKFRDYKHDIHWDEEIKGKAMATLKNLPNIWKDFDAKNCDAKQLINGLNTIVVLIRLTDLKDDESFKFIYANMCDAIYETLKNLRDGYPNIAETWVGSIIGWLDTLFQYILTNIFI